MFEKLNHDELMDMLKKDALLQQIVRVIHEYYPNSSIYTGKTLKGDQLDVYPSGLSIDECTKMGQLISSDYSRDYAGDNMDYPFFIDVLSDRYIPILVDVTHLYDR